MLKTFGSCNIEWVPSGEARKRYVGSPSSLTVSTSLNLGAYVSRGESSWDTGFEGDFKVCMGCGERKGMLFTFFRSHQTREYTLGSRVLKSQTAPIGSLP
ncbi:hypothetical protein Bca52824_019610 [Brassica carinata]|uniref:Uncharacterized protein n=1 Tax=Brassica carinata TaxID=52824 RepID=A0A8X7VR53_BRACI|nr:hypothetical protein Bca52824_019610 [Brassica carinata]